MFRNKPENGWGEHKGNRLGANGRIREQDHFGESTGAGVTGNTPMTSSALTTFILAIDLKGTDLEVIRGASFRIPAGKTVALVGESGSGKSILSQAILGILPNVARITGGNIWYREKQV